MNFEQNQEEDRRNSGGIPRRVRINPDIVSNRIGDRLILVHLETDRIFELNRTAARFWELLSAGHDRSEIQRLLLQEFDTTETQLTNEIENQLNFLCEEQFIIIDHEH
jgi:Coenzyme PQQ synthesis protein D (PqqD)